MSIPDGDDDFGMDHRQHAEEWVKECNDDGGGGSGDDDDDDDDDDGDDGSTGYDDVYESRLVVPGGLSTILSTLLECAFSSWITFRDVSTIPSSLSPPSPTILPRRRLRDSREYAVLLRTLRLLSVASRSDPTLAEEILMGRSLTVSRRGRDGGGDVSVSCICSRLVEHIGEYDTLRTILASGDEEENDDYDDDQDALADLQDAVFDIYSPSYSLSSHPRASTRMPLTDVNELRSRLPLMYDLTPPTRGRGYPEKEEEREEDVERRRPRKSRRRGRRSMRPHRSRRGKRGGIDDAPIIYISQVLTRRQSAQSDVGFVMWPSAIVLSRYLVVNPQRILDCATVIREEEEEEEDGRATGPAILELGAGCGLVGITAARLILASRREKWGGTMKKRTGLRCETEPNVVITDVNDTVLDNILRNIELNDVSSVTSVSRLDFYDQSGDCRPGRWIASKREIDSTFECEGGSGQVGMSDEEGKGGKRWGPFDVVLAADIICKPEDAIAASKTIYDALRPSGVALVVCANAEHRFGVEIFAKECEERGLVVSSTDVADMYNGDLMGGDAMETAAGYVHCMRMTFFEITKYDM